MFLYTFFNDAMRPLRGQIGEEIELIIPFP